MKVASIHSDSLATAYPPLGESELSKGASASPIYRNIVVPVDDGSVCEKGVWEAIGLATALRSRIKLIHVINRTPWMEMGTGPAAIEDLIIQTRGVEIDAKVIEGFGRHVGELIVAEASSWPADLIILGARRRRSIRHILMGGTVEYILHRSPIPVLLIPAH